MLEATNHDQWRPQFEAALEKLAEISSAMDELDLKPPILVGGGAVELYTQGAVNTGDFDLVSTQQTALETIMMKHGFIRPSGPAFPRGAGFIPISNWASRSAADCLMAMPIQACFR
jgi:hypothetical protein